VGELKDANTNPWYVLMTLYGEQTEEEFDGCRGGGGGGAGKC